MSNLLAMIPITVKDPVFQRKSAHKIVHPTPRNKRLCLKTKHPQSLFRGQHF
jgi:hypothetical protein